MLRGKACRHRCINAGIRNHFNHSKEGCWEDGAISQNILNNDLKKRAGEHSVPKVRAVSAQTRANPTKAPET